MHRSIMHYPFANPEIAAVFDGYQPEINFRLLKVRRLIFDLGATFAQARIEESLKWGQPSYATIPKTGTPIRLGQVEDKAALFVHCQTHLIRDLNAENPHQLRTIDNRAVMVPEDVTTLNSFITAAFTYHR